MTLTLTLRTQPPGRVFAGPLLPERLRGLNPSAVAGLMLRCGAHAVAVGELFEVSGAGAEDEEVVLAGDLRRFEGIGARMSSGQLTVRGDAGAWAGTEMSGGVLRIFGDAGARLGAAYPGARVGMTGGEIIVSGDAGARLGAAYPGARVGMTGGEIIVSGDAGEEAGAGLRRGLIAVGGRTGSGAGLRMLAGTVIALGGLGAEAGIGNKRGSLVSGCAVEPLPSYAFASRLRAPALGVQLRRVRELGLPVPDALLSGTWARWSGDRTELTRGEILVFDGQNGGP